MSEFTEQTIRFLESIIARLKSGEIEAERLNEDLETAEVPNEMMFEFRHTGGELFR